MTDQLDIDAIVQDTIDSHYKDPATTRSQINDTMNRVSLPPKQPKKEGKFTRFMHGGFLPASVKEAEQTAQSFEPWQVDPKTKKGTFNPIALAGPIGPMVRGLPGMIGSLFSEVGEQAEQAKHAFDTRDWKGYLNHSLGAAVPGIGPPLAGRTDRNLQGDLETDRDIAGGIGRAAAILGPHFGLKVVRAVVPEQFKSNLIDKAGGEGFVDSARGKDTGLALRRAKVGPLTRGSLANRSAGITRETGLPRGMTQGLDEAGAAKERFLQHPAAQAKTIDGKAFIEKHFGPIRRSPLTGDWETTPREVTASNIGDTTVLATKEFGDNLINAVLAKNGKGGWNISPADIEAMRAEKVIDVDFGKVDPSASAQAGNAKAAAVSRDLIRHAEDAVRLPSGESALELLNSQKAGLMQGKKALLAKFDSLRTSAPKVKGQIRLGTRGVSASTIQTEPPSRFNAGGARMWLQTGLADLLTEKPWWLENPTRGLPGPPPGQMPGRNVGNITPGSNLPPGTGPGLPPGPPGMISQAPRQLEGGPPGVPGGETGMTGGAPPTAPGNAQINFPPQPTHIAEGMQVSDGASIAGPVNKIYASVENGVPTWKALVFDKKIGKNVEVPADQLFDRAAGPPGVKKATEVGNVAGKVTEGPTTNTTLPRGTHSVVNADEITGGMSDLSGGPPSKKRISKPSSKPPGTEGAGVFGDTKTLGPDKLSEVVDRLDKSIPFEDFAAHGNQGSPFVDDFVRNQVGRHLGYNWSTEGQNPGLMRSFQEEGGFSGMEPYPSSANPRLPKLSDAIKTRNALLGSEKPPGTKPAGIAGGPPIGPDEPFRNPEGQSFHELELSKVGRDAILQRIKAFRERIDTGIGFDGEPLMRKEIADIHDTIEKYRAALNKAEFNSHLNNKAPTGPENFVDKNLNSALDAQDFLKSRDFSKGPQPGDFNTGQGTMDSQGMPKNLWGPGANPKFLEWAKKNPEQFPPTKPYTAKNGKTYPGEYEVFDPETGDTIGWADTVDDANILMNSHDYYARLGNKNYKHWSPGALSDFEQAGTSDINIKKASKVGGELGNKLDAARKALKSAMEHNNEMIKQLRKELNLESPSDQGPPDDYDLLDGRMPTSEEMGLINQLMKKHGMNQADAARTAGIIRRQRQTLKPYEPQATGNEWDRMMQDPEAYNEFFQGPMSKFSKLQEKDPRFDIKKPDPGLDRGPDWDFGEEWYK